MVKKIILKINVRFTEHMDAIEVRRKLITFNSDPSLL
jgi:hypothetical protein